MLDGSSVFFTKYCCENNYLFQVENLKKEVGKRSNEQQRKARDRSADTQRIKDLERQVSATATSTSIS